MWDPPYRPVAIKIEPHLPVALWEIPEGAHLIHNLNISVSLYRVSEYAGGFALIDKSLSF